jgi:hypothetical protein
MKTSVQSLFTSSRPAAIVRGVGTVVVDAIKLMVWRWTSSHVSEKADVTIPTRIDRYASAAVALPIFVFGIAAAIAHIRPNFPFWSAIGPITMIGVASTDSGVFIASAGPCSSALQINGSYGVAIAADTEAKPVSIAIVDVSQRGDRQEAESLSGKIFDWVGHTSRYTIWEA